MASHHIIFDCDGVLVDSEPLSMKVDVEILSEHGVEMSEEEAHRRFVGKTFAAMIDEVAREYGVSFPADTSSHKEAARSASCISANDTDCLAKRRLSAIVPATRLSWSS